VHIRDDEGFCCLANQGERVLQLRRILIGSLLAKFNERNFVAVFCND